MLLGSAARQVTTTLGEGKVVAVFQRSFYVASASGALACIGPPGLGAGPLNLLCAVPSAIDWPRLGLRVGAPVGRAGDALQVGTICRIALDAAASWQPEPLPPWTPATLRQGVGVLASAAAAYRGAGGFATLIPALAAARPEAVAAASRDPLLRLALPGIAALAAFLAVDADVPDPAVEILLGLGPGLTPSGDDLIGGALVALRVLGRDDGAWRLAAWTMPCAAERTSAISAAHLRCAAEGEGSAALHDMLAALVTPGAAGVAPALAALAAIGHSSGLDMLAGAALVAAVLSCAG